jgi:lysyl-tRNA synthetase, class II
MSRTGRLRSTVTGGRSEAASGRSRAGRDATGRDATGRDAGRRDTGRRDAGRRDAGRRDADRPAGRAGRSSSVVEWMGRAVLLAAWWSLLRLIVHPLHELERGDDVFALLNLPVGPSLFSTVVLFIVGGAIRRRMRAAWWLLFVFQVVSGAYTICVLTGLVVRNEIPDHIETFAAVLTAVNVAITGLVLTVLAVTRPAFISVVQPGARLRAAAVLVGGLAASLAAALALTFAAPGRLRDDYHRIHWAVRIVFGVRPDRSDLGWAGQYGHGWIADLVGLLSGLSVVGAGVLFVRSGRVRGFMTAQDEFDLRTLIARTGERDSLAWFATRRDKSVVFTPRRDAAITYRVVANVSLASADPIGPPARWPAAIAAWLDESRAHGWFPAVLAAGEPAARAYCAAGLKALPLGDEAIIDTESFTLDGPEMQSVRRAVRRIRRLGYTISVHRHADLDATELAELAECAGRWRVDATERGFSMALGRLGDPLDGRSVAVLARDRDGRLRGLLSLVPWGRRGLSLDLMRRDRESDNGLNEAMVAALVRQGSDQLGVVRVSLNFAMFRGVFEAGERLGAGPLVRLTNGAMRFASRFWQIESLYRSNARYRPRWQTRYVCFDSALTLTRVSLAAGAAEGFLPTLGGRPPDRAQQGAVVFAGNRMPLAAALAAFEQGTGAGATDAPRLSGQQRARLAKVDVLARHGIEAYPASVPRDRSIADVRAQYADVSDAGRTGSVVAVVGRVRALRRFGRLVFAVLEENGSTMQVLLTAQRLGDRHELARRTWDLGDLVSVTGEVGRSERGELSVLAHDWLMAGKCLTPVAKLRPPTREPAARPPRQLELLVEPRARQLLEQRTVLVRQLRAGLDRRGFGEVETPMLQAVHGGANARPFRTQMNAFGMPLSLRIAPELHLKRLAVGGRQRIYELNRNFRNEGVDDTHNPEFTALEAYQAFADYHDMRTLVRALILEVATAVHGAPVARRGVAGGGMRETDLSAPWPIVPVYDAVSAACCTPVTPATELPVLQDLCRDRAVPWRAGRSPGELVSALYEQLVEACTVEPTFYVDFPTATSPLTRAHRDDPRLAQRWDLVAWGQEIATAYSELTDPIEQRRRLTEQSLRRSSGDPEAMELDEEFLAALAFAMPPTGGLGLGVDRLLMMLTGVPIRDTLAFPFTGRGGSSAASVGPRR